MPALLLILCAIGSALTRHRHGATNVLSNIFFFTLALLLLACAVTAGAAGINRLRTKR